MDKKLGDLFLEGKFEEILNHLGESDKFNRWLILLLLKKEKEASELLQDELRKDSEFLSQSSSFLNNAFIIVEDKRKKIDAILRGDDNVKL